MAGGAIAGAVGIPGLFAACATLGLLGAAVVGCAVLGPRAGIGPARAVGSVR